MPKCVALMTFGLLPALAFAQLPPGFELVDITNDNIRDRDPRMNDRGQIVFQAYMGPSVNDREIILYDNGEFIQLTDDNVPDGGPDINRDGVVVWLKAIGPDGAYGPTSEIMMYDDGEVTRFTDDEFIDSHPRVNALGQVVWSKNAGEVPCGAAFDVFFFDGQSTVRITDNALADRLGNFSTELNEHGDLVWTEYNDCNIPWTSRIMMYSGGKITQLSPAGQVEPQAANVNKNGLVAWSAHDGAYVWQDGNVTKLTDWGASPILNNRGDIAISRWHAELQAWQGWLYRDGVWYQLTNDFGVSNFPHDINRWGEVVMESGSGSLMWDIRLLRRSRGGEIGAATPSLKDKVESRHFP